MLFFGDCTRPFSGFSAGVSLTPLVLSDFYLIKFLVLIFEADFLLPNSFLADLRPFYSCLWTSASLNPGDIRLVIISIFSPRHNLYFPQCFFIISGYLVGRRTCRTSRSRLNRRDSISYTFSRYSALVLLTSGGLFGTGG